MGQDSSKDRYSYRYPRMYVSISNFMWSNKIIFWKLKKEKKNEK